MTPIRPATKKDLDRMLAIAGNVARHMNAMGIDQWDTVYPDRSLLGADIGKQGMYVIEAEGAVAGMITLNEEQPPEYDDVSWTCNGAVLVVHRLAVDPEHQGKGMATKLMDFAEKRAASLGYDAVRLDAFTRNPVATALYTRRGYEKTGTVRFPKGIFACFEKPVPRTGAG